jgi:hypothetical protein
MTFKRVLWIVGALAVSACGGKASPASDAAKAGAAADAAGSGGGVPCGATICKQPAGYTGLMCCRDSFSGACGQLVQAGDCRALPAQTEANCPDGTVAQGVGVMFVRGCCMKDTNQCGLDFSGFGAYCNPLSDGQFLVEQAAMTPDAGGPVSYVPPATNCDGTPGT